MRLEEVVNQFLLDCEVKGRTKATLVDYRYRLHVLLRLLQEVCMEDGKSVRITDLEQVKIVYLRQCIQHLLTAKRVYHRGRRCESDTLAPTTVRACVRVYKSFFHWCYIEELINQDLSARLTSPKVPVRVVSAFTPEHIERMLETCDTGTATGFRNYVILLLLLDTGMRIGELCGLTVSHVYDRFVRVFGKGRREREIGIHPEVSKLLWKYIHKYRRPLDPDETALFIGRGKPLHIDGVQDLIKRIQRKSGLDHIRFTAHVFRHTFAKEYLAKGGEIFKLSREMGHSDIQVTKNYLEDFTSSDARKDHAAFSPVSDIKLKKRHHRKQKRE